MQVLSLQVYNCELFAKTLALVDYYHAMELKAICLKFPNENLGGMLFYPQVRGFFFLFQWSQVRVMEHHALLMV